MMWGEIWNIHGPTVYHGYIDSRLIKEWRRLNKGNAGPYRLYARCEGQVIEITEPPEHVTTHYLEDQS